MRWVNLCTFKRLQSIDASASYATPVAGSTAAHHSSFLRSSSLVVQKVGAVPLYATWPLTAGSFWGRWTVTLLPSYQRHWAAKDKTKKNY